MDKEYTGGPIKRVGQKGTKHWNLLLDYRELLESIRDHGLKDKGRPEVRLELGANILALKKQMVALGCAEPAERLSEVNGEFGVFGKGSYER